MKHGSRHSLVETIKNGKSILDFDQRVGKKKSSIPAQVEGCDFWRTRHSLHL
jgi:hypothetical protein